MTIAANAGYDGSLVVGKLLEQNDCNFGFDAAKGESSNNSVFISQNANIIISRLNVSVVFFVFFCIGSYVDMVKAGIIDPVKVIKTALTDAAR